MPKPQDKKLNLPLYLNPVVSQADRAAMEALQHWYTTAKQNCQQRDELDGIIRGFHRDLYLAGLRLHQINPRLCRHVAEAMEQSDLDAETFSQQLSACGLLPSPAAETTNETVDLTPLTALLAEQSKQLGSMQDELSQLRKLAEQQARQLQKMKFASSAPSPGRKSDGSEEMDVSAMQSQIKQMQKVRAKGIF